MVNGRTTPAPSRRVPTRSTRRSLMTAPLRTSCVAALSLVTAGATTANQTVSALGTFNCPGFRRLGSERPRPDEGHRQAALLSSTCPVGRRHLRFNLGSGDFDWFVLEPATKPTSASFKPVVVQGGNLILEWTGGGTLQAADNVNGPWTDVAGATSPRTVSPAGARKFYRIKL